MRRENISDKNLTVQREDSQNKPQKSKIKTS
jgi:hypothetical protein